jgi:hypothetical protein
MIIQISIPKINYESFFTVNKPEELTREIVLEYLKAKPISILENIPWIILDGESQGCSGLNDEMVIWKRVDPISVADIQKKRAQDNWDKFLVEVCRECYPPYRSSKVFDDNDFEILQDIKRFIIPNGRRQDWHWEITSNWVRFSFFDNTKYLSELEKATTLARKYNIRLSLETGWYRWEDIDGNRYHRNGIRFFFCGINTGNFEEMKIPDNIPLINNERFQYDFVYGLPSGYEFPKCYNYRYRFYMKKRIVDIRVLYERN